MKIGIGAQSGEVTVGSDGHVTINSEADNFGVTVEDLPGTKMKRLALSSQYHGSSEHAGFTLAMVWPDGWVVSIVSEPGNELSAVVTRCRPKTDQPRGMEREYQTVEREWKPYSCFPLPPDALKIRTY